MYLNRPNRAIRFLQISEIYYIELVNIGDICNCDLQNCFWSLFCFIYDLVAEEETTLVKGIKIIK